MHPWVFAVWSCGAPAEPWIAVERVVAVVDDDVVLASELERRVAQARAASKQPGQHEQPATLARETLRTMVEEQLVARAAARLGLTIDESTVDAAITQLRDANQLDDAGFARAVADGGWTMAEYRLGLRQQLLRMRLLAAVAGDRLTISDAAVQAAYDAEKAKNPALGDLAGASERLRAALFERAMNEAYTRWLTEAQRTAHVELRL